MAAEAAATASCIASGRHSVFWFLKKIRKKVRRTDVNDKFPCGFSEGKDLFIHKLTPKDTLFFVIIRMNVCKFFCMVVARLF